MSAICLPLPISSRLHAASHTTPPPPPRFADATPSFERRRFSPYFRLMALSPAADAFSASLRFSFSRRRRFRRHFHAVCAFNMPMFSPFSRLLSASAYAASALPPPCGYGAADTPPPQMSAISFAVTTTPATTPPPMLDGFIFATLFHFISDMPFSSLLFSLRHAIDDFIATMLSSPLYASDEG
jgi:hypothetical protein